MLLLHAGIADRRMWHGHIPWFADRGLRAIVPDLPGFGEHVPLPNSPAPWDYAQEVLDELEIERATVVGCSFGGAVAQRLAVIAPDRVGALALISAPAPGIEPSAELTEAWRAEEEALEAGDIDGAVESVLGTWLQGDAPAELRELVAAMQRRAYDLQGPGEHVDHADPIDDELEALKAISAPTVVAAGEYDLPDFLNGARALAETIQRAEHHVIAGAGHLAPLETPDAFRGLLDELLRRA